MKVKQLIRELLKHDLEKEVMIQQGEEYDHVDSQSVKTKEVLDVDSTNPEDDVIEVVVIEY